jgi:hypothetical protein
MWSASGRANPISTPRNTSRTRQPRRWRPGFTKVHPGERHSRTAPGHRGQTQSENGLTYKPSQIIVSCGGKHSCYNVIFATCEEGDEVIIPAPYWLSYPEMVKLAGAKPVIVETTDKTEFKMTPDAAPRRHHAEDPVVRAEFAQQPDRHGLHPGGNQSARRCLRGEGRAHHERRNLRAPAVRWRDVHRAWPVSPRRISSTRSSCTASPKPGA